VLKYGQVPGYHLLLTVKYSNGTIPYEGQRNSNYARNEGQNLKVAYIEAGTVGTVRYITGHLHI
jgi:hypothetical protein